MHILFSTIGDDGSRQYGWDAGVLAAVVWNWIRKTWLVENCSHKSSINLLQYIFHDFFENSREIYIQYIFHVIKNLHKEMHILFPTIGDEGSRQLAADAGVLAAVFWNWIRKTFTFLKILDEFTSIHISRLFWKQ